MRKNVLISLIALLVSSFILMTGCKKDNELATVTTGEATEITAISAVISGDVTNEGGTAVVSKGICYSKTSAEPVISDRLLSPEGSGSGSFTCTLIALSPDTKYYARAYATNIVGTSYGNTIEFTTSKLIDGNAPTVTTGNVSSIGNYSANCGGEVTNDGGLTILAKGVCWSKDSSEPNISDLNLFKIDDSEGNSISCKMEPLLAGTKYYVRAFATNAKGTSYGETKEFTTEAVTK
jgi:FlaG/FlaF family flagellin (archaellin)